MNQKSKNCFEVRLRPGYNLQGREAWVESEEDEPIFVLPKGQRPAKSAVTMANAIMFEYALMTGCYPSVRAARKAFGITRGVSQRFFKLLSLPAQEIESLLNEVY